MARTRQDRDKAVEKLYAAESEALVRAEAALGRLPLSTAATEPFRDLTKHYRRLLRQTMKVTAVSDATQLRLRTISRELSTALEKVETLNTELHALQKEKDEIFAMAVHDLKSPLSGVCGLANIIADPELSGSTELRGMGREIYGIADAMLEMVADLVDLYRFETSPVSIQPFTQTLGELREAVEQRLTPNARRKHSKLVFVVPDSTVSVTLSREYFLRIAANLISNAIKYSPPGSTIEMTLGPVGDKIQFSVKDQGPGISAADQKKLFRKFTRLSARPTGGETSSGLGLAIVKRIVEQLQGEVWCDSALGQGSTFHVTLPRNATPSS